MRNILLSILSIIFFIVACEKVEPGFLSEQMRYKDNVIYCKKGLARNSQTVSIQMNLPRPLLSK